MKIDYQEQLVQHGVLQPEKLIDIRTNILV